ITGYGSSIVQGADNDLDFLGAAKAGDFAMVQLFQMRGGRVVGRDKRFLSNAEGASDVEILEAFMADYYGRAMQVPDLVLVPGSALDRGVWQEFLTSRAGKRVRVHTPQRGDKVELIAMAERNAATGLEAEIALLERRGEAPGVGELQKLLDLDSPPWRVEGFD